MENEYYEVESFSSLHEAHMFFYGKAIDLMITIHGKDISKVPIGDLLDSIEFFAREFHSGIERSYENFLSPDS